MSLAKQGGAKLKELQQLMQEHRQRVEASIRDLQESLQIIDAKIDFYSSWQRTGIRPPSTTGRHR